LSDEAVFRPRTRLPFEERLNDRARPVTRPWQIGFGVVLTALVTFPNWPFFNRNPLKWLDTAEAERHPRP